MSGSKRSFPLVVGAVTAVVFGLLSIASGGRALFGGEAARQAVGAYVPFANP